MTYQDDKLYYYTTLQSEVLFVKFINSMVLSGWFFFFWSIFSVMICVCRCEHCIRKSGMLQWFSPLPSLFFQFATSANEEVLRAGLSAAFNKWGSKQTFKNDLKATHRTGFCHEVVQFFLYKIINISTGHYANVFN